MGFVASLTTVTSPTAGTDVNASSAVCRSAAEMSKGSGAVVSISLFSKLPFVLASKKIVRVKVPASGASVNCCDSSEVPLPGTVRMTLIGASTEDGPVVAVRGATPETSASAASLSAVPASPFFSVIA